MGDFFLLQMDDFFAERECFVTSKEGEGGAPTPRSPFLCEGQSEGSEPSRLRKLRLYERSRCAEHGGSCNALGVCVSHRGQSWSHPSRSRATQDAKPRPVFYGAVSRSMRSTSSRGRWIAPANLSALSSPRSTISSTVV